MQSLNSQSKVRKHEFIATNHNATPFHISGSIILVGVSTSDAYMLEKIEPFPLG